jgi:hypothetical protein
MNAVNTFDHTDAVKSVEFGGIRRQGDAITLSLPSKSIVMLEF